jgi:Na+/melibiose symporter-like transporter
MGSYRSPAVALMPDLTPKPLRSKANAIINLMGTAGGIYSLIVIRLFVKKVEESKKSDYTLVFLFVAILMIITVSILVITIRENKLRISEANDGSVETVPLEKKEDKLPKEVQKSLYFILLSIFLWFMAYNAISTAFSRYATQVWKLQGGSFANSLLVATIAAIFSYIPIGIISSYVGRKKTIIGGIILITIAYFTAFLFTEYSVFINVIFAITGIAWAAINVNSYPMVVEMSKGSDVGKYTGLYYTFSMTAQTITPILSGFLLQWVSYRTLFPYAVCFSLLSLCTMMFVKHGDVKPLAKGSILENYDVDDEA